MDINNKYLLIYHKEDNDGLFSATILRFYLMKDLKIPYDNIDMLGADYNMLNEFSSKCNVVTLHEQYDYILMTDISFNDSSYMKLLYNEFKDNFIWFDHHSPAIAESKKRKYSNIPGIRDTSRSALLNVFKYCYDPLDVEYNNKNIPELLRILSAWDSWSYKEEGYDIDYVKNINIAINAEYKLDLYKIQILVAQIINSWTEKNIDITKDDFIMKLSGLGYQLNKYDEYKYNQIIENFGDCTWKIYTGEKSNNGEPTYRTACAIFSQGPSNSTMFQSLIKGNKNDIMNGIVFKRTTNGNWMISLYNIRNDEPKTVNAGGFHCGDFLKKYYNGGGHMGAAGCTVTEKEFIKILKNKYIGKV